MSKLTPLTLEVIQSALTSIAREMAVVVRNAAHSRVMNEGKDFSCALFDGHARLVALGADSPSHIFPLVAALRAILDKYCDDIGEGDVFIVNDPEFGGTHLNDVAMAVPMLRGGAPVLFGCVRAHWADIGGMVPGSLSGRSVEIFQEGVRIPPIRVVHRGTPNAEALDLLFRNVRLVDERIGDFYAMRHGCGVGISRVDTLIKEYGFNGFADACARLEARAERRLRDAILTHISPGRYVHEDFLDSAGHSSDPVPLRVAIDCADGHLRVDFSGTSPQVAGPTNCSLTVTTAAAFIGVKALLDPFSAVNHGAFAAVEVTAPAGTCVNAIPPAACGGFAEVRRRVQSVVLAALTRAWPEGAAGDQKGTANHFILSGTVGGRLSILYEYPAGGVGGTDRIDGPSSFSSFDEGDFDSISAIEAVEHDHPLRAHALRLRAGSAGSGRHRGGFGMERVLVPLVDGMTLSVLSDRNVVPPYGVDLGGAGAPNAFDVERDGVGQRISEVRGKVMTFPLRAGDHVIARSAGGGGYGDPLTRATDAVAADVAERLLTALDAMAVYGVVLCPDGTVDPVATAGCRDRLRVAGMLHTVASDAALVGYRGGRRMARLSPRDAASLRVVDSALIELARAAAAPLRAWIISDAAQPDGVVAVGPDLLGNTGLHAGDRVLLRVLSIR